MDMYNSQTSSAVTSPNRVEETATGGTSHQSFETPFRINVVKIKTNNSKILVTNEESGVSEEEERDYYKKTLRSKLV